MCTVLYKGPFAYLGGAPSEGERGECENVGNLGKKAFSPQAPRLFPLVLPAGSPTTNRLTQNKLLFYEILAGGSDSGAVSFRDMF